MKRPHMSTGAWIFATAALVLAVAAPVGYAAATSTVAIGNATNGYTATVDAEGQVYSVMTAPRAVIRGFAFAGPSGCSENKYEPPPGKAIVLTSVTYDVFNAAPGQQTVGWLSNLDCSNSYDVVHTLNADYTEAHTFPAGLPLPAVGIQAAGSGSVFIYFTGYLIPAAQLPAASTAGNQPARLPAVKQASATHR